MSASKVPNPLCAALVFVDASSFAGENQPVARTANSHIVGEKLRAEPNIIFAHAVLGEANLLAMVTADTPFGVVEAIEQQILVHQTDRHNYVSRTRECFIVQTAGRAISRENFDVSTGVAAWILLDLGVPGAFGNIVNIMKLYPGIHFAASTVGEHKAFLLVEADDNRGLGNLVDNIRQLKVISDTTTLMISPP